MKKNQEHGFTLVELMVTVSILGVLSTVASGSFVNYTRRAKTTEAAVNIDRMYEGAVTYFNLEHVSRGSTKTITHALPLGHGGWTPTGKPKTGRGTRYTRAEWMKIEVKNNRKGTSWKALDFTMTEPFYYKYRFLNEACPGESCAKAEGEMIYCDAEGDLDGDAEFSLFSRAAEITRGSGGELVLSGQAGIVAENPLE